MKKRSRRRQETLWIAHDSIAESPGHPFYEKLEAVLRENGFDAFVELECGPYYAKKQGRPSIPPGVYFRMLMIGYFERIDSERGICWRCADSLSLRGFLGVGLNESTPHHASLSRIRSRLALEVHESVFAWVLRVLAANNLIDGKTLGVDGTTLEANAALRSIVRRDTGQRYEEFLKELAKASGIETPTRTDLAKLDRKRPKKGSNKDWKHPHDPDAQIMKMKDGRTHLAHKLEQAVDMSGNGAVLSVTLHGGAVGDTKSLPKTLEETQANLDDLIEDPEVGESLHQDAGRELVADKGYHGNDMLEALIDAEYRTYISEPDRGRRNWKDKEDAQRATYANRRRVRGARGKRLLRRRGELLERPFAHYLEAGGMRRTHLRKHGKILKRLLVHVAGFNLGILMRNLIGTATPRVYADQLGRMLDAFAHLFELLGVYLSPAATPPSNRRCDLVSILCRTENRRIGVSVPSPLGLAGFSTGC
ncbi:MAG: transposase [Planctomycetota bacterium]